MKILISAYACEPNKGSEPGVGWHWVKEISQYYDVIVITRKNNRFSIEDELRQRSNERSIEVVYYDLPKCLTFWKKGLRGVQLYYYLWQYGAYRHIKSYTSINEVGAVLAVTFGNIWKPTFMYKLGMPMIWGPVGGGEEIPKELLSHISNKQRIFEMFRRISKKIPLSNPWFYQICKHSKLIITRTYDSLSCIPTQYKDKCRIMIETGVDESEYNQYAQNGCKPSKSKTIVYIGRLLSLKMVDIALRAFAYIASDHPGFTFEIVGDGEMRGELEKLANQLGISKQVKFLGMQPREKVLSILSNSRCLIMPSCKEGGAWVLFEAMMCGRPIVCMDTAGMKVVVNESFGIKIRVDVYNRLVEKFRNAIEKVITDPDKADELGSKGCEYVRDHYLWSKKGNEMKEMIREVLK